MLTQDTVDILAYGLARTRREIEHWFDDPSVKAAYERWLKEKEGSTDEGRG